ncbi:solute carrier family 28 member 3-like [Physella acuta]|uniref:solute carrier family 28 member 3-like n=1 Tax=Physella acuta TaxID=109671 RepID=UPI0027DB3B80|nr:solute carrier family 28 member 3-like [Physella acuta]
MEEPKEETIPEVKLLLQDAASNTEFVWVDTESQKEHPAVDEPQSSFSLAPGVKLDKDIVFEKKPVDPGQVNIVARGILAIQQVTTNIFAANQRNHGLVTTMVFLCGYFIYFGFAMNFRFGDEGSIRLLVCTIIGILMMIYTHFGALFLKPLTTQMHEIRYNEDKAAQRKKIKWALYIVSTVVTVTLIIVLVALKSPRNLLSLGGLAMFVILGFLTSYSPALINWHPIYWGFTVQFYFAVLILKTKVGYNIFLWLGDRVTEFLAHSDAGAKFVFGDYGKIVPFVGEPIEFLDSFRIHLFAFTIMPVITFFSTVISVLYYLGVMQKIVLVIGRFLAFCLGTTPAESLNAAGNIFVSMTESPLMIRPYIGTMTSSELHAVMVGGFATIAGSVLGAYIGFGVDADHLLSASVMSAPAALAISKLTYPEIEIPIVTDADYLKLEGSKESNVIEAACSGAIMSTGIIACVMVNVMAFLSLLNFVNATLNWLGTRVGVANLSFELLCSYVMFPVALFMGTELQDCMQVAELVGIKTFTNEFIAFQKLAVYIGNRETYIDHIKHYPDDPVVVVGRDYYLGGLNGTRIDGGFISHRSETIATYALCGFSNVGSMGILLGSLSAMAPARKATMSRLIFRAMVAGNVACFVTACIAGLVFDQEDDKILNRGRR